MKKGRLVKLLIGICAVFVVVAMAFLGLFLIITMLDTIQYTPDVDAWREVYPE